MKTTSKDTSSKPLIISIHGVSYLLQIISNLAEVPATKDKYAHILEDEVLETALLFYRDTFPRKSINVFAKNALEQVYWKP